MVRNLTLSLLKEVVLAQLLELMDLEKVALLLQRSVGLMTMERGGRGRRSSPRVKKELDRTCLLAPLPDMRDYRRCRKPDCWF